MDIIEEDSEHLSESVFEVPVVSLNGIDTAPSATDAALLLDDSSCRSESSADFSDSGEIDFAKQLRKQRKQVLEEKGKKVPKVQDFSHVLRQHREELVETWRPPHKEEKEEVEVPASSSDDDVVVAMTGNRKTNTSSIDEHDNDATHTGTAGSVDQNGESGDVLLQALSTESLVSEISGAVEDFGDDEGEGVVQEAISFEGLEQNISFDSADDDLPTDMVDLPPGTPSRLLDDLLAVTPNSADGVSPAEEMIMPDPTSATTVPSMTSLSASVDESSSPLPVAEETPAVEDEFGGEFSATTKEESSASTPPTNHVNHHMDPMEQITDIPETDVGATSSWEDEFGDFDAAPSDPAFNGEKECQDPAKNDDSSEMQTIPQPPTHSSSSSSSSSPQADGNNVSGDLDATLMSDQPGAPENNDNNDFRDFDGVPSSQPINDEPQDVTLTQSIDDNDEFGAFGAAKEPSQPQASYVGDNAQPPQPEAILSNDDDDFGDFDAVAPGPPETSPDEGDDFGDFGAALRAEMKSAPSDSADYFGDFGEAAAPSQPAASQSENAEAFGDFGATKSPPETYSSNNKDDFGDFDAASSEPQISSAVDVPAQLEPQAALSKDDDDDFGDFDAAPSQPETSSPNDDDFGAFDAAVAVSSSQPGVAALSKDGDDFGEFGDAPSQPEATPSNDDDFGDFDAAPAQPEAVAANDDGDDFGDFGDAPSQPEATPSNDDDDFGDFDAAPAQPEAETANDDGDDFGDFGDAPSQPEATPSNDDDDFGDFDAAPAQQEAETANDDGDDFGEFGDAPSQPEATPSNDDDDFGDFGDAPPQPEATLASDDDDDFGDFDTAAAPSQPEVLPVPPQDGDDFGDFDAAPSQRISKAPAMETQLGGQDLEVARNLLARLQSKYTFAAIEATDGPITSKDSLSDFLQLGETKDDGEVLSGSVSLVRWLNSINGGTTESTTSALKRIIEEDGRGSFAQFDFPTAGLPTSEEEMERQRRGRRVSLVTLHVPDVLPIQLPTGEENPLEASSPKSKRRSQTTGPSLNGATDLQFPILESKVDVSQQAQSASVKELLRKIPDLSFMLESKLVLPKK